MTDKLPRRYFIAVHKFLNHLQSSAYSIRRKKLFGLGTEIVLTIDVDGIPEAQQENEIKAYLTSYAWVIHKNGK